MTGADIVVGRAPCGCCPIHLSDLSPEARAVLEAALAWAKPSRSVRVKEITAVFDAATAFYAKVREQEGDKTS